LAGFYSIISALGHKEMQGTDRLWWREEGNRNKEEVSVSGGKE
jgi:hypothetical protein